MASQSSATRIEVKPSAAVQAKWIVPALMGMLAVTGTANSIAGKIRSEPLGDYSGFVTSMISQVVYFTTYWTILGVKWFTNNVSREELRWVWTSREESDVDSTLTGFKRKWALLPGFKYTFFSSMCDVMGDMFMFLTQPFLSIILFNLLQQGMVPFTLLWSLIFLTVRYTAQEVLGVALVMAMAITSVVTSSSSDGSNNFIMTILCLFSTMFQALGFVIKEVMFRDYTDFATKKGYKDTKLDVFAVSSSNHTFGVIWVFPLSVLVEMARTSEPVMEHIGKGFDTLWNAEGAMAAFCVYMVINVCFNITIYLLVSYGTSLLTFVTLKITVPLAAFLSLISWPLIGASTISWFEWLTLVVIMAGIILFRHGNGPRGKLEAENQAIEDSGSSVPKTIVCLWPFFGKRKAAKTSVETA